jgi:hypothetical protein
MACNSAAIDMVVKLQLYLRKKTEFTHMEDFMELPPKTLLNSDHRFCGIQLEHTKHWVVSPLYCYVNSSAPSGQYLELCHLSHMLQKVSEILPVVKNSMSACHLMFCSI